VTSPPTRAISSAALWVGRDCGAVHDLTPRLSTGVAHYGTKRSGGAAIQLILSAGRSATEITNRHDAGVSVAPLHRHVGIARSWA